MAGEHTTEILFIYEEENNKTAVTGLFHDNHLYCRLTCIRYGDEIYNLLFSGETKNNLAVAPALVLIDLPHRRTMDAVMKVKAHPQLAKTPVVVTVASGEMPGAEIFYGFGISAHMAKPVTYGDFARVMIRLGLFRLLLI